MHNKIINRIKEVREINKLTQSDFAKALGVSQGNIGDWERGRSLPTLPALLKIVNEFGISADWLLLGEKSEIRLIDDRQRIISLNQDLIEEDIISIRKYIAFVLHERQKENKKQNKQNIRIEVFEHLPLIGRAAAGRPLLINELVEGYIPVEVTERGQYDNCYLIQVQGESMIEEDIHNGDLVIVRPQPAVENGEMALVRVGDEATIKHFNKQGDKIYLKAANKNFPNLAYTVDSNIAIIGKVLKTVKKEALEKLTTEMPEEYKEKLMRRNNLTG